MFFAMNRGKNKKGFTLIELIVVFVVVGVLVGLAFPAFKNSAERERSKNAQFNLVAIYQGQKRYRLHHQDQTYYSCNPCAIEDINSNLSLKINDAYFGYSITAIPGGYSATATRLGGTCADSALSVTHTSSTPVKSGDCDVW